MGKSRCALLAALAVTALAGSAAAEEVMIGDLHPITGPASFYGLPQSRAITLAAEQINAAGGLEIGDATYEIRVVSADTQGSPTMGIAALKKLQADGVRFILGPLASAVAPALKPIFDRSDDLTQLIDGTIAGGVVNGRNVFRNQAPVDDYNRALEALVQAKGYEDIAIMTDRVHAGFMESQDDLVAALEATGSKIATEEYYKFGDTNFSAQMTTISALNPAALVIRGYPAEGALITRMAQQLGYEGQIIWEFVSPPSTVLKNISAEEMEGVLNAIPPTTEDYLKRGNQKALQMAEAYRARFDAEPGELTALSYDALLIMASALEKAGSLENDAVNQALAELRIEDVPGLVNGYEPFEGGRLFQDGQAMLPAGVQIWQGDGWEPIDSSAVQ